MTLRHKAHAGGIAYGPDRDGTGEDFRQCWSLLVLITEPRRFLSHPPNHFRVYVAGPRAARVELVVEGFWLVVSLVMLAAIAALI